MVQPLSRLHNSPGHLKRLSFYVTAKVELVLSVCHLPLGLSISHKRPLSCRFSR
jgi:hypothetical protein